MSSYLSVCMGTGWKLGTILPKTLNCVAFFSYAPW
jgi:hypothetical protein